MKLRSDQLKANLKRQLMPIYIIAGDEPLQVSESCDLVRQQARRQGFSERHVYQVEGKSYDWSEFLETANSLSLFAQKQILEVRIPGAKPGDAGRKALAEYLALPSKDNLLLLVLGRVDQSTQKAKWFRELEQVGVFIPVWPIEVDKLPGWISQRLKSDGFAATSDALSMLAERIEGNLLAAAQEIEKLKLLAKDQKIDADTVRETVSDSARFDVFQLSDAALSGDIKNTVRILGGLRSEGIEPPIILWALAREIRLLSHLGRLNSNGLAMELAIDQAAKIHGFAPFMLKKRRPLLEKSIRRHSEHDFRQMLLQANQVDQVVKGQEKSDEWDELLGLSLKLAGAPPILTGNLHPA